MEASEQRDHSEGNGTVEQRLRGCIESLLTSARRLRAALATRDVEAIWEALAEQEEQAGLLTEYGSLWQEMRAEPGQSAWGHGDTEHRHMHVEMKRLQALQRANSMLAQSFLSAIRKAIDSANSEASGLPGGTYSKHGRRRPGVNSRLVKRLG